MIYIEANIPNNYNKQLQVPNFKKIYYGPPIPKWTAGQGVIGSNYVAKWILKTFGKNTIIYDPFAGRGTFAHIGSKYGLRFILGELDVINIIIMKHIRIFKHHEYYYTGVRDVDKLVNKLKLLKNKKERVLKKPS